MTSVHFGLKPIRLVYSRDLQGLVINYAGGRGIQNEKIPGPRLFAPPPPLPLGQSETFCTSPLVYRWKLFVPPFSMAKTSGSRIKTALKLFVTPISMAKTFSSPPPPLPVLVGVKLQSPPPPPALPHCFLAPLPVIND